MFHKSQTYLFYQVGELHHSPAMSNINASDEVDCLEFVVPPPISQPELGQGYLLVDIVIFVCKRQFQGSRLCSTRIVRVIIVLYFVNTLGLEEVESRDPEWFPVARMNYLRR